MICDSGCVCRPLYLFSSCFRGAVNVDLNKPGGGVGAVFGL